MPILRRLAESAKRSLIDADFPDGHSQPRESLMLAVTSAVRSGSEADRRLISRQECPVCRAGESGQQRYCLSRRCWCRDKQIPRQVGRVTPCAPQPARRLPNGAHGVTRPTRHAPQDVTILHCVARRLIRSVSRASDQFHERSSGIWARSLFFHPPLRRRMAGHSCSAGVSKMSSNEAGNVTHALRRSSSSNCPPLHPA